MTSQHVAIVGLLLAVVLPPTGLQASSLSFAPSVAYATGGLRPLSVAMGDVNGDGKADVVVANLCVDMNCAAHGTVSVLLGNGDGTFKPAVNYDSGGYNAESVALADVNGDGKPDVVVANLCPVDSCFPQTDGSIGVLLGNGDGTFKPAVNYDSGGRAPMSVAIADVNGDGNRDVIVENCGPGSACTSNGTIGVSCSGMAMVVLGRR